ncbi:MAG: glycosyltransferase family 2 protein [Candidatus Komeilibacteria bacterium]|nr:glycosyltransferase family 2 protein [Candidatus Komeilibacteria bacterium]
MEESEIWQAGNPYRFWEILPAVLIWGTLLLLVALSFVQPLWAIYFVIIYDLFWIIRIYYLLIYLLVAWAKYRKTRKIDWCAKRESLMAWSDYQHIIFLPMVNEPFAVVDRTLTAILDNHYPSDKLYVVLAGEERAQEHFSTIVPQVEAKYANSFKKIIITLHPKDVPDEIIGKGSNLHYAGREVKKFVDDEGLDYDKIIVSSFDIDTCVAPNYFDYLTYLFITTPNPTHKSYQPLAFYHNNVWESDPFTRVAANSTTFWLLTDLARAERLFTFSSHSMSWRMLTDIGFWQKDIVTEDSRIFLQGFFRYQGDYQVVPMYTYVSMNTVYMGSLWRSLVNQYKQMRRWAWGVEHLPYMIKKFKQVKGIPAFKQFRYLWNQTEGMYSWATAPLIITLIGRLPLWWADKYWQGNVFIQSAPLVLEKMMTIGIISMICVAIFSLMILPNRPSSKGWYYYPIMFLQWILFPITFIIFGSIPAIDAQTRLALGGRFRLGFWVTEKK